MSVTAERSSLQPLAGSELAAGNDPPARLVAAHARALGAKVASGGSGELVLRSPGGWRLTCRVGIAPEPIAQARCGLMHVHGRDAGSPQRLGLGVASVATGVVAMQALLGLVIAVERGLALDTASTSSLDAALLFVAHHLAIATASGGSHATDGDDAGPGPPFATADGDWVELEALSTAGWVEFWQRLGVPPRVGLSAWSPFVLRYLAGTCRLPSSLHDASRRHRTADLRDAAAAAGVAVLVGRSAPPPLRGAHLRPWKFTTGGLGDKALDTDGDDRPLSGLRVVELATRLQGPLVGELLLQLGAEVIKVEPHGGDIGRAARAGFGFAAYSAYNRGKRVLEVDIKSASGQEALRELAAEADVFVHNAPPGRAERLGFDYRRLSEANPGLVYGHASGWGESGPTLIAGDFLVQAHTGLGRLLRPPDEPPFPTRLTLLDVTGGLLACEAILAGMCRRVTTGRGCAVETSLLGAANQLRRHGGPPPSWCPFDHPLRTQHGYLALASSRPSATRRLAAACGLPRSASEAAIAETLGSCPAACWARELASAGVDATVVCEDVGELIGDPSIAARLEGVDGSSVAPAAPWSFAA